jgi:O-succinylhomoserine sulfhydrylase
LQLIDISNNLGDSKTLLTHPSSTTHSNLTADDNLLIDITPTLCRLSVGIEHVDDIINDLQQSLT